MPAGNIAAIISGPPIAQQIVPDSALWLALSPLQLLVFNYVDVRVTVMQCSMQIP